MSATPIDIKDTLNSNVVKSKSLQFLELIYHQVEFTWVPGHQSREDNENGNECAWHENTFFWLTKLMIVHLLKLQPEGLQLVVISYNVWAILDLISVRAVRMKKNISR